MSTDRIWLRTCIMLLISLAIVTVSRCTGAKPSTNVKPHLKKALCQMKSEGVTLYATSADHGSYSGLVLERKGVATNTKGSTMLKAEEDLPRLYTTSRNVDRKEVLELTLAPRSNDSQLHTVTYWLNKQTLTPETSLLASTSDPVFKLTAQGMKDGNYDQVRIQGKEVNALLPFVIPQCPRDSLPKMAAHDWDGDDQPEVAIIFAVATGTGVNLEEAHVLDLDNMKEIPIEDAVKVLNANVKSSIDGQNIIIKINDRTIRLATGQYIKPGDPYNNSLGGEIVSYDVDPHGDIIARSGADTCNTCNYIGYFIITYQYQDGAFKMKSIDYKATPTCGRNNEGEQYWYLNM